MLALEACDFKGWPAMGTKKKTRSQKGKPKLTREDRYDIAVFQARRNEPRIPFEQVVNRLKKVGLL